MAQDYQRKRLTLLLVTLLMPPVSQTVREDFSNYTLLLPWSDVSWEATENNDLFLDNLDPEEMKNAILNKDQYLGLLFSQCRDRPRDSEEFDEIRNAVEKLKFFSETISHELGHVLFDRSFDRGSNKTIGKNIKTDYILMQFLDKGDADHNPLEELKRIISFGSTNGMAFVEKYLEYKKLCKSNTSQLQNVDILLGYIRWICVKIYGTVIAAQPLFTKLGYESERFKVLSEALYEFRIEAIREVHDGILDSLKKNYHGISSVVHNDRPVFHKLKEIGIFRRVFVEKYLDLQAPHVSTYDVECSIVKEAPQLCESHSPGNVCPVWFSCNNTRCQHMKENISVCLDKANETQIYGYYLSEGQPYRRECKYGFHHLSTRSEFFPDTHRPIETFRIPCECLCERENTTYYYSTMPALTDLGNDMVVTGARLELVNNVLIIRIMQSKLRINGTVDPATSVWLFHDVDASDRSNMESISLSEMNAIDLTRVQVSYGQVVVGLSLFRGNGNNNRSDHRIKLRIHSHGYDYEGGKLIGNSEHFDTPSARSEVEFKGIVLLFLEESLERNKFIRFSVSRGENGGNTTIPLIDSRKLIPDVSTPLSGAGFYVRKSVLEVSLEIELLTYNWMVLNRN